MKPTNEEICCPPFDPAPWDDKFITWENKPFIKDRVCTLFYIPLNFGGVMTRLSKLVVQNQTEVPDYLCLSEHTSKWNMDVHLAVDRVVPGASNETINGKFYSRVYEGNFNKTREWMKDFETHTHLRDAEIEKIYLWYTTCPKCAKKYGKNYIVILGKIKN